MKGSDTELLLLKSNEGSKMAVSSIDRALKSAKDPELRMLLKAFRKTHTRLGERLHEMLNRRGYPDKEPGVMARAMANMTMSLKLLQGPVDSQVAKLMMDGCNMGIQSLAEYRNHYKRADEECRALVKDLISCEYDMMSKMERFL